jgi:hypothetical protein
MSMARPRRAAVIALLAATALAVTLPAIGQDRPESILPPGFGDPEPAPPKQPDRRPADILPDAAPSDPGTPGTPSAQGAADPSLALGDTEETGDEAEDEEGEEQAFVMPDLPPSARRSLAMIGVLRAGDGDMGIDAFRGSNGRYLHLLMRNTGAPVASRWASILLRRALLSTMATPRGVHGADWAAERAWLLLRMGEADAARMLVQAVDADQYTPKMDQVAMQAALATSDPAMMCAFADTAERRAADTGWVLARAMCSGLSGDNGQASALLDRARDVRKGDDIDILLSEKVVGATAATRRTVAIQWDGVTALSAWRFGLASATAVEIPAKLFETTGPQVRAWAARAPLIPFDTRAADAERAAAMGVFSSAALVDFFGIWRETTDATERSGKPFETLRTAYAGESTSDRIAAMRALWDEPGDDRQRHYARQILTARAAAAVSPDADFAGDAAGLIASMLSAGLDLQADRWSGIADDDISWGLLAAGGAKAPAGVSASAISDFGEAVGGNAELRASFLFAGLAGLGRVPAGDVAGMAEDFGVATGRTSAWTQALDRAVADRAPGTVALLCAIGLQARNWSDIPPHHLYRVVRALTRIGYEAEARMIAAEAIMRA